MVSGAVSLGIKGPERETDHSPLSIAEVKKMSGAIPPLPQYVFMVWRLVKNRDNFIPVSFRREREHFESSEK